MGFIVEAQQRHRSRLFRWWWWDSWRAVLRRVFWYRWLLARMDGFTYIIKINPILSIKMIIIFRQITSISCCVPTNLLETRSWLLICTWLGDRSSLGSTYFWVLISAQRIFGVANAVLFNVVYISSQIHDPGPGWYTTGSLRLLKLRDWCSTRELGLLNFESKEPLSAFRVDGMEYAPGPGILAG